MKLWRFLFKSYLLLSYVIINFLAYKYNPYSSGPSTDSPEISSLIQLPHDARQTSRFNSSRQKVVPFRNETATNLDLIRIDDHDHGDEVVIRKGLIPGDVHRICTGLGESFIARDTDTRQLRSFRCISTSTVVFEGLNFGFDTNKLGRVSIFKWH